VKKFLADPQTEGKFLNWKRLITIFKFREMFCYFSETLMVKAWSFMHASIIVQSLFHEEGCR
jgi:hypothetical protein